MKCKFEKNLHFFYAIIKKSLDVIYEKNSNMCNNYNISINSSCIFREFLRSFICKKTDKRINNYASYVYNVREFNVSSTQNIPDKFGCTKDDFLAYIKSVIKNNYPHLFPLDKF